MPKFKVTNESKAPKYLVEAGRLLHFGESVAVNRLDPGTRTMAGLKIEEGDFAKIAPPKGKPKAKVMESDDDLDTGVSPTKMSQQVTQGAAALVDAKTTKRSTPMRALDATEEDDAKTPASEDEGPMLSGGAKDDDLDAVIKPALPASAGEKGGLATKGELASKDKGGLVTVDEKVDFSTNKGLSGPKSA